MSVPISRTVNLCNKVIQRIEKIVLKKIEFIDYAFVLTNSLFIKSDFYRANFIFGVNCFLSLQILAQSLMVVIATMFPKDFTPETHVAFDKFLAAVALGLSEKYRWDVGSEKRSLWPLKSWLENENKACRQK